VPAARSRGGRDKLKNRSVPLKFPFRRPPVGRKTRRTHRDGRTLVCILVLEVMADPGCELWCIATEKILGARLCGAIGYRK
jgi:hypothetical protein